MVVGRGPGHIVSDGDAAPSPKRSTTHNSGHSVVAKRLDVLRCHYVGSSASAYTCAELGKGGVLLVFFWGGGGWG